MGKNYTNIAKSIREANPNWSEINDDVSLCSYVSRNLGVELTLKEAEKVRTALNKLPEVKSSPLTGDSK